MKVPLYGPALVKIYFIFGGIFLCFYMLVWVQDGPGTHKC